MKIVTPLVGILLVLGVALILIQKSQSAQQILKSETKMSTQIMSETDDIVKTEISFTKPTKDELKSQLTEIQFQVTQKNATERPYSNEYNDEKREGIYVDIVSGEPLFSSKDKFDSGTGWPSFSRPLEPSNIAEKTDYKLLFPRTEVRSFNADSHLGHVFKDGPTPTGLRYCMNSAAMKFIPKEDLVEEGYEKYAGIFQ